MEGKAGKGREEKKGRHGKGGRRGMGRKLKTGREGLKTIYDEMQKVGKIME